MRQSNTLAIMRKLCYKRRGFVFFPARPLARRIAAVAGLLVGMCLTGRCESLRIVISGDGRSQYPWSEQRSEDEDGMNKTINREIQQAVLDEKAQVMLWTGDLVNVTDNEPGTLKRRLEAWRGVMQPLYDAGVVVLPVRGNHEVFRYTDQSFQPAPIPEATNVWNSVFTGQYALPDNGPDGEKNLSFFFSGDSTLIVGLDQYENKWHSVNQAWLNQVLQDHRKPFIFVFGHEPAFMAGNHRDQDTLAADPAKRNAFWESLVHAGVQAYFCGHDHFYDHKEVVRSGENSGQVHQVTAGTAGAPFYKSVAFDGNKSGWALTQKEHVDYTCGYLLAEISESKVIITFKERYSSGKYLPKDSFVCNASLP